jgi:hypothetical protein
MRSTIAMVLVSVFVSTLAERPALAAEPSGDATSDDRRPVATAEILYTSPGIRISANDQSVPLESEQKVVWTGA